MTTDADDLFASLGGALMRDILGTNSNTTSEDILSSLEAELDASMPPSSSTSTTTTGTTTTNRGGSSMNVNSPHGLVGSTSSGNIGRSLPPPGLSSPPPVLSSGAALIVSHQQQQQQHLRPALTSPFSGPPNQSSVSSSTTRSKPGNVTSATDPWGGPIFTAFDSNAVDDFLRNDAARKKQKEHQDEEEMRRAMDKVLFEDDEDEEDWKTPSKTSVPALIPEQPKVTLAAPPPLGLMGSAAPPVLGKVVPPPPPPPGTNSAALLPPFLQSKVSEPPGTKPTTPMSLPQPVPPKAPVPLPPTSPQGPPPGPPMLVPPGVPHNIGPIPPMPPHPASFPVGPPNLPPPPSMPPQGPLLQRPGLPQGQPLPLNAPPFLAPPMPGPPPPPPPPQIPSRFFFHHPHPSNPPIPATKVASSLMTARDVSYVIHSMLRPLHVLHTDPDEDYYYGTVQLRRANMMPPQPPHIVPPPQPPDPSLSQTKESTQQTPSKSKSRSRARSSKKKKSNDSAESKSTQPQPQPQPPQAPREIEAHFRKVVENRAKEWKEQSQVLGHVVKSNVHQPRALLDLASFAETAENERKEKDGKGGATTEEGGEGRMEEKEEDSETVRVMLWKARKLIDSGYSLFLHGNFMALASMILETVSSPTTVDLDLEMKMEYANLETFLTLPKGRDLLSRCLEYKRAPMGHPNNCTSLAILTDPNFHQSHPNMCILTPLQLLDLLPSIFTYLFSNSAGVKQGEDRMLYIIISHLIAIVDDFTVESEALNQIGSKLLAALIAVVNLSKSQSQLPDSTSNLKKTLGSRARAEVMHALITKGVEICEHSTLLGRDWKSAEEEFIGML